MKTENAFIVPIKGMGKGLHQYDFHVDGTFFESREESPIDSCDLNIRVDADKRENMLLLQFNIQGVIDTDCDRCTANIALPVTGEYPLIVKLEEEELRSEEEVLILHPETPSIDLSDFIYEFTCLSLPLVKIYDCRSEENPPCDERTIEFLEGGIDEDDTEEDVNPIWDDIKKKLS